MLRNVRFRRAASGLAEETPTWDSWFVNPGLKTSSALPLESSIFNFQFTRLLLLLAVWAVLPAPARAEGELHLPPEATEGLRLLYSGDPDAAMEMFRRIEERQPDYPVGYLLEANAQWWKIYCAACEIKYNTIDAWHRARQPEDDAYLALTDKGIALAEQSLKQNDTAEMRLYAGIGWGLKARLLGLWDDRRGTAPAGVRAREHLFRAVALDPEPADPYTGLGPYKYYVCTPSPIAQILRFFLGLSGSR